MRKKSAFIVMFIILVFLVVGCTNNNQMEEDMQEQTFLLETAFRKYANEEINVLLFEEIINSSSDTWNFMVLEPDKPIRDSTFIQVGASWNTTAAWPYKFNLEIGFGNAETGVRMYRLVTEDKNVVLQYLIDYWKEQIIPDISLWQDVSDELW